MNSKRLHLILITLIGLLLVGLVVGAYGVNSLFAKQADKLTSLKAKSLALSQEHDSLIKAKKEIKKYADLEKIAQSVVPEDKNQAEAVREIVNIAAANNIKLASINFPASTLGNGVVGASGSAAASAATTPSTSTNPKTGSLSQLQPVKSIPGVYQLLITVNGDPNQPVQYSKFVNFLAALEHNRRTSQVSTVTLQPDINNRDYLSFTLTLNEYIKP